MNSSIPDDRYYLKYGLKSDPFPPDVIDKNIFLTPAINRRLKEAKQHIITSERLLIITSPPGAGKSLLAQKLMVLKAPDWRISQVNADPGMEPESLAHIAVQQLLPESNENGSSAITRLHKYLEQSHKEETVPVIIVDDADKLPLKSLEFILQLGNLRYKNSFFRFVIFADESITESISKTGIRQQARGIVDYLSMPSFTQEQIIPYLNYRFSACGKDYESPFTDREINYLYRASSGLPRGINVLARRMMQDHLKQEQADSYYGGLAVLLSLLVLALSGYLFYESTTRQGTSGPAARVVAAQTHGSMQAQNRGAVDADEKIPAQAAAVTQVQLPEPREALSLRLSDIIQRPPMGNDDPTGTP